MISRREVIAGTVGSAAVLGGAYTLSRGGAAEVKLDALTTLEPRRLDLSPDGVISNAGIGGTVEIEYESPGIPIREAMAGFNLDYHGADGIEGPELTPLRQTKRAETNDDHAGSLTFRFSRGLNEDWGFELSHFDPDPGETITHDFLLVAEAAIYENVGDEDAVESLANEDSGSIVITRPADDDQEPTLTLAKSEFSFSFQTTNNG